MKTYAFWTVATILCAAAMGYAAQPIQPGAAPADSGDQRFVTAPGFVAHLNGQQEVPEQNSKGKAEVRFYIDQDGTSLRYMVHVYGVQNVNMVELHLAARGQPGPVIAWLYPESRRPLLRSGEYTGRLAAGLLTSANFVGPLLGSPLREFISNIDDGNVYAELCTLQNPEGELRGQLVRPRPNENEVPLDIGYSPAH
jgi:hypothetical protein